MKITIIRTSGWQEVVDAPYREIRRLIGADALDSVSLRDGRIMLIDDSGHEKHLPANKKATDLYHAVCYAGTVHQIVGDCAIVVDDEVA